MGRRDKAHRDDAQAGPVLGAGMPYTLIVMWPTNERLEDPGQDIASALARRLLVRWDCCRRSVPG